MVLHCRLQKRPTYMQGDIPRTQLVLPNGPRSLSEIPVPPDLGLRSREQGTPPGGAKKPEGIGATRERVWLRLWDSNS